MADWYVSSVAFAAVPVWAASTAYTVGQFVRATAPAASHEYVWRCTTAGTSGGTEPTWANAYLDGNTIASGGATFTNVAGRSAHGWSAALGSLNCITYDIANRPVIGDRVFLSSDHSESGLSNNYRFNLGAPGNGLIQIISVNRAGSVPPVAADLQSGAAITAPTTGGLNFDPIQSMLWHGITFTIPGTGGNSVSFATSGTGLKMEYFKNCAFVMTNNNASTRLNASWIVSKVVFDNTTVQFGNVGQRIGPDQSYPFDFTWINTPSAIQGATIPTTLFHTSGLNYTFVLTCRGVDLSAITGTLVNSAGMIKALFDSCRIAPGVTRWANPSNAVGDEVELVNCWDGTNVINERRVAAGDFTTDRSNYVNGGVTDDIGAFSHKLSSSSRSDKLVNALESFWMDLGWSNIGASRTAAIEIGSPASLNSDEIRLVLEYMGTSGNPLASFVDSLATVLTPAVALPASSAVWTTTPAFATWSPADFINVTFSNSNRTITSTSNSPGGAARGTQGYTSGKYYWEVTCTQWTANSWVGIVTATASLPSSVFSGGVNAAVNNSGAIWANASNPASLGARANGDIIGIAVDFGAGLIWFRVAPSGNWNGSGTANPATATGGVSLSAFAGVLMFPSSSLFTSGDNATANFGTSAFSGTVPSGFTSGLPASPTTAQQLQVTFTPQRAGRIRGQVRLGKAGSMVWINPRITVT